MPEQMLYGKIIMENSKEQAVLQLEERLPVEQAALNRQDLLLHHLKRVPAHQGIGVQIIQPRTIRMFGQMPEQAKQGIILQVHPGLLLEVQVQPDRAAGRLDPLVLVVPPVVRDQEEVHQVVQVEEQVQGLLPVIQRAMRRPVPEVLPPEAHPREVNPVVVQIPDLPLLHQEVRIKPITEDDDIWVQILKRTRMELRQ